MSTLREYVDNTIKNNQKLHKKSEVQIRVLDKNEVNLFVIFYHVKDNEWSVHKDIFFANDIDHLSDIDGQINISELMETEVIRVIIRGDITSDELDEDDTLVKRFCVDYKLER